MSKHLRALELIEMNFNSSLMPDSPGSKSKSASPALTNSKGETSTANLNPTRPISADGSRPMNGLSPTQQVPKKTPPITTSSPETHANTINHTTYVPPTPQAIANQQLPPACGARQLAKLKRFLTTLQQFANDISLEIGERVRLLILDLVNNHFTVEDFHAKLQEETNFPLRPFVIPFLKANLPLLQRELMHCARIARLSPNQFLTRNQHFLFVNNSSEQLSPEQSLQQASAALGGETWKRKAVPTSAEERGEADVAETGLLPPKRKSTLPSSAPSLITTGSISSQLHAPVNSIHSRPIRLDDFALARDINRVPLVPRSDMSKISPNHPVSANNHQSNLGSRSDRIPSLPLNGFGFPLPDLDRHIAERWEEDWKYLDMMLNYVGTVMDRIKTTVPILQERQQRDREDCLVWKRRALDEKRSHYNENDANLIRQAEERVADVRRRAEDAVAEVKRQAVLELQKAVAAAETKANELVQTERAKMREEIVRLRVQIREEVMSGMNVQEESSESCWNCGRKASETCSGCNVARYCGPFCQHKDWESHHKVCSLSGSSATTNATDAADDSAETVKESNKQSSKETSVKIEELEKSDLADTNKHVDVLE